MHYEDEDEDLDVTAVYVLGDKKIPFTGPEADAIFDRVFKEAMKEARRKHKEAGVPMVVWKDGKIARIQPDEIEID
jgi:hypothetical protein